MKTQFCLILLINLISICYSAYDYQSTECQVARKLEESGFEVADIGSSKFFF